MRRKADAVFAIETHAFQRPIQCCCRHAGFRVAIVGEQHPAPAGMGMQFAQHFHGLPGQEDNVRLPHLHPLGRDAPFRPVNVDFRPMRPPQFHGANEGQPWRR